MIDDILFGQAIAAGITPVISQASDGVQFNATIPQFDKLTGRASSPIVQTDSLQNIQQNIQNMQATIAAAQTRLANLQTILTAMTNFKQS